LPKLIACPKHLHNIFAHQNIIDVKSGWEFFYGFMAATKMLQKMTNICHVSCKRVVDISLKISPSNGKDCLGEKLFAYF